ncbi:MAG TPA: nuclear transport factor 2 family protein [Pyrinomonadaceae bacterium]|jgi:hypothetical protein
MSEAENVQVVQSVYEAFGRGDLPAMLDALAGDVRWVIPGPSEVPYLGERKGHEGVRDFVVQLTSSVEFEQFEVLEFIAHEDKVVVTGRERGRVKATGRTFDNEWAMFYTLRDGKILSMRSYENTGALLEAFRA